MSFYKKQCLWSLFLLVMICIISVSFAQTNYARLVNPFVGTGGHGHTYPGATLPHGMVQLSPDTRLEGWDGCGGYHYSDNYIYGFTHTHLSGTGIPDFCDILLMPFSGVPSPDNKKYGSGFSHKNETAHAGYYSVLLNKGQIRAELTATERVGLHHYSTASFKYGASGFSLMLDLKHRDEVLESSLNLEDSVTISGLRRSRSWAENQYVYFVMKFSKPLANYGVWRNDSLLVQNRFTSFSAKNLKAFLQFDNSRDRDLYVKVALSTVSIEGAKKNLLAELPGWDFEKTKRTAEQKWNAELGKIEVEGNEEKRRIFYTALYHTAVVPNINMDVDGNYRGRDNNIHHAAGFDYYSVFSLWDTYRAAHPLYTIIDRKRTLDYIKTFLAQYKECGRLPVWELAANETECMIGYHCVPVIVDAYVKGIRDFDTKLALEAMVYSAKMNHFGLEAYKTKGIIESDDEQESVSRTLEYAYDDWCIATFAKAIGDEKVFEEFNKRAQYYKNVLDPKTGFMRPRKNGDWLSPFDPREVNNNYTEANAWQYSFYMPHDIEGYKRIIGGADKLEKKLDDLFSTSSKTTGREQSDITGLIGQYAHGNEPSHHIAYLYNYTNAPYKTQSIVKKIMTEFYKNTPDGLIGNEDCGQMSAWYVMSAMGFYQVTPGTDLYVLGAPLFKSAKIHLENGKMFSVQAANLTDSKPFVLYAETENSGAIPSYLSKYLDDATIQNGETITFEMTDKFSRLKRGPRPHARDSNLIVINPVINGGPVSFQFAHKIAIVSSQTGVSIFFTTDGTEPGRNSLKYTDSITIDRSMYLKAVAYNSNGEKSFITTANYKKMVHDWSVKLNTKYEQMYDGGGALGLIDGIRGETNWRKGNWQGYQKADVDVTVDLKKESMISNVSAGFLQDTRAWIVVPKEVTVEVSKDGKTFIKVGSATNILPIEDLTAQVKTAQVTFISQAARFVRIKALQYGKLPSWHESPGGDTHIFLDEVEIE